MARLFTGLIALLFAMPAFGKTDWSVILIDGLKSGYARVDQTRNGDRLSTTSLLEIEIVRSGTRLLNRFEERYEETADGQPLAFSSRQFAGQSLITSVTGRIDDRSILVKLNTAGRESSRTFAVPPDLLFPAAIERRIAATGLTKGAKLSLSSLAASSGAPQRIDVRVGAKETIELMGKAAGLVRIDSTYSIDGARMQIISWVDRQADTWRASMNIGGLKLELVRCDEACARAPNQPPDLFMQTLVRAPRALLADELIKGVRYTVASKNRAPLSFSRTDEQRATRTAAGWTIDVCERCGNEAPVADADYLRPTDWLQSDAPEISQMAATVIAGKPSAAQRMKALEQHVRGYITTKDLSVGYASALDTVRSRTGDCTEHALLLAALGRSAGIATRVAFGFAYFGGKRGPVFVPHAWTQALIDGRWRSFDAALNGFDAGHIAVDVGQGDPGRFSAGLNAVGNLRIIAAEPLR